VLSPHSSDINTCDVHWKIYGQQWLSSQWRHHAPSTKIKYLQFYQRKFNLQQRTDLLLVTCISETKKIISGTLFHVVRSECWKPYVGRKRADSGWSEMRTAQGSDLTAVTRNDVYNNQRYWPDKLRVLYITSVHFRVTFLKLPNTFLLFLPVSAFNGGGRISYYFVLPKIHPTLREPQKSIMPRHAELTGH
jgi:hypothetical protein